MSQTFKEIVSTIESEIAAIERDVENGISIEESKEEHMANIFMGIYEATDKAKARGEWRRLRKIVIRIFEFAVSKNEQLLWMVFSLTCLRKGMPFIESEIRTSKENLLSP